MEWKKAPDELVAFLAERMKGFKCEHRKMFGYPAYFVNGNMFAGLHGDKMFLRLSDKDVEAALRLPGVNFLEPMKGRPMKEYLVLPESLYRDDGAFSSWLERSFRYASSLPSKKK